MQAPKFDLITISRIIYAKRKFVVLFAIAASVVGLLFSLVATKQYASQTMFIVKSPELMDRNYTFRQGAYEVNPFFANENQIDHIMTISKNEILPQFLADSFDLMKHYGLKSKEQAFKKLARRFKVTRNDTRSISFTIKDSDPQLAADMVNVARMKTNEWYYNYFLQDNRQKVAALQKNIERIDATLINLNDSIEVMRSQYGIYDQLLPLRGDRVQVSGSAPVSAQKMRGMERLEKLTSTKEQLIKDRATYLSLINEYALEIEDGPVDMFYTVQYGWPGESPAFPKMPLILLISFFAGLIFSVFLVLLQAGVQFINKD